MNQYACGMKYIKKQNGFTLVEMLIVIGLIALLATSVLVAVNPSRQFKFARDTERKAHLATILNAISQNIAENNGSFKCDGAVTNLPSTTSSMTNASSGQSYNVAPCLVPEYLAKLPHDPSLPGAHFTTESDYATGYTILQDTNGHITLSAQSEMQPSVGIAVTR